MISCPNCQKKVRIDSSNKHRPFCSKKCKLIDLGEWDNEEKKIWKLEETTEEWKKENLHIIKQRLTGWQLESFEKSYNYKCKHGISLEKKRKMEIND